MSDSGDPNKKGAAPAKPLTAAQKLKKKRERAKELRMMHKLGIPTPKKGGLRAGAGQKPFVPVVEQRLLVKILKGDDLPEEQIALAIINPATGYPITTKMLHKHFALEMTVGRAESLAITMSMKRKRIMAGSDGMIMFDIKNKLGWRSEPLDPRGPAGKGDEYTPNPDGSGPTLTRIIRVEGGLPKGSTPANPGGDDYDDVPPPEERK